MIFQKDMMTNKDKYGTTKFTIDPIFCSLNCDPCPSTNRNLSQAPRYS